MTQGDELPDCPGGHGTQLRQLRHASWGESLHALYCVVCDRAWVGVRRVGSSDVSLLELDLTVWELQP